LFTLAVGALGPIGCVEVADDQLGMTEQAVIECETWVCGSNSPILGGLYFHELNVSGVMNAEGVSVINLWQAGTSYQLSVEHGRIIGRAGSLQIQGAALQNAQIRVRRGAQTYAIRIAAVSTMQTFAQLNGAPRTIETYLLDTAELAGGVPTTGWRNLCSNIPSRYNPDLLGMNVTHALVFEGERIDKTTKQINPALDSSWFNIGCAGHAIAKLAINAQTEVARVTYGFTTTIPERQAFLRMLTGDYCGKGKTFTVSGQPLQWMDWRGYTQYVSSPMNLELEARWTATGAACLNTPRVIANPSQLGTTIFGSPAALMGAIQAECGGTLPPPCPFGVTVLDNKPLNSANPL
jgi:hypothetical protein